MAGPHAGPRASLSRVARPSRRHALALGLAALWAARPGAAETAIQTAALNVGLVPYLTPRQLLTVFEPLRLHLQQRLSRPLQFYTASNFARLLVHARSPEQPFTLMPMHLAMMAVEDWGFRWVARSTTQSVVQLWSPSVGVGPLQEPAALRGRRVAVTDPLSVVTLMFRGWCDEHGLADQVRVETYPNLGAALKAAQHGEADLVLAPEAGLRDATVGQSTVFAPVLRLGSVLTPGFVASPAAADVDVTRFREALLDFRLQGTGASAARYAEFQPADADPYRRYTQRARLLLAAGGTR